MKALLIKLFVLNYRKQQHVEFKLPIMQPSRLIIQALCPTCFYDIRK